MTIYMVGNYDPNKPWNPAPIEDRIQVRRDGTNSIQIVDHWGVPLVDLTNAERDALVKDLANA
jgi:hypothetical protein